MPLRPILIVTLLSGAVGGPALAQPALETRIERLQAKLESIQSIRAIKRLQYAYGHYVEFGLWNDFADLFTDDAVTNYQQGARGKNEVRKLFFEQVGQGRLGLGEGRIYPHILFQPVITLAPDGRSAKGRWRILAMLGGYGGSATWYSGVYENQYALQGGAWKIAVLRSEPKVTAAYSAAGWKDSGVHVPFHYSADSVTAALSGSRSPGPAGDTAPSFASMADRVARLARQAAALNDQDEVANLQDTYGYAVDRKLWDQAADLFSGDGTLELGLQGVYAGRQSIRRALGRLEPQGLNDHVYLQTIVSVAADGRAANARGIELIMSGGPGGGELSEGVFENTFVKQDRRWKIQSVHFYPRMIVDASAGWAKSAKPAPGPSKELPPDRMPASSYGIYPKFAVAPFHFDNPVTGKPPQYPAGVPAAPSATAAHAPAPSAPPIRNASELETRLTELERSLRAAEAYDAAENLIGAYAYCLDESPDAISDLLAPGIREGSRLSAPEGTVFVSQMLQPVIDVARDGRSARVHARLLDLGGNSGGRGYWIAGAFQGRIALEGERWKFQAAKSEPGWTAAYPGGWGRTP